MTSKKKQPWMPWYVADWLTDPEVKKMTRIARSIYFDMICLEWAHGPLIDDPAYVARLLGEDRRTIAAVWPSIRRRFVADSAGNLVQIRLESERNRQRIKGEKSAKAAKARWSGDADALPACMPSAYAVEMPSESESEKEYIHTRGGDLLQRLAITWEKAGLPMASSTMRDIADLVGKFAASRGIADLDELALGLFQAFGKFRASCGIKPPPSPIGFVKHWETVVEWFDGKGKPPARGDPAKRNGVSAPVIKQVTARPYGRREGEE